MTEEKLRKILGNLAGAASLCWEPKPEGVFDSSLANRFVDEACLLLQESHDQIAKDRKKVTVSLNGLLDELRKEFGWRDARIAEQAGVIADAIVELAAVKEFLEEVAQWDSDRTSIIPSKALAHYARKARSLLVTSQCSVCRGQKIINTLTGMPPNSVDDKPMPSDRPKLQQ